MADWNPARYLAFADERARPIVDLLARVEAMPIGQIVDLGCGPGNSTALLRKAFPTAQITGIDSSPAMIDRARTSGVAAVFKRADVLDWCPSPEIDLVFANALFQWIPDHELVMQRIFFTLRPGAVLAVQMPDNLAEHSHRTMLELAQRPEWVNKLGHAQRARSPIKAAAAYHELLFPLSAALDVWRTTYHHQLRGHQGITDMFASTGLKPFTDALDDMERGVFLQQYTTALEACYPVTGEGMVLLPFPRLFIVASRANNPATR